MAQVRLGILGGGISSAVWRVHAAALRLNQSFEVVAGCFSRDPARNAESARAWGLPPNGCVDSLDDLLHMRLGLDAIVVLTPTTQHFRQVREICEGGITCISEKSLVTCNSEAQALVDVSKKSASRIYVTYNYVGYPMVQVARRLIAAGDLGEVHRLEVAMPQEGFMRVSQDGGWPTVQEWRSSDGEIPTISLDLGVHVFHLMSFLLSELPQELVAVARHNARVGNVVDYVSGIGTTALGRDVSFSYGKDHLGFRNGLRFSVVGSEGTIEWRQSEPDVAKLAFANGTLEMLDRGSPTYSRVARSDLERFKAGHPVGFVEAFGNLYADILNCIADETAAYDDIGSLVSGPQVTTEVMSVLKKVQESADNHCWVS